MEKAIYVFEDVYQEPAARSQADSEKVNAFGWAAKLKLWDRPKEADIQLLSSEKRFEPFWNIAAERDSTFEKKAEYSIHTVSPYAQSIRMLDQSFELGGKRALVLAGVESCFKRVAITEYFDGLKRQVSEKSLVEYATKFQKHELGTDEVLHLMPPEHGAAYLIQQVKARLMEPIQADEMLDDTLQITSVTLYYRPVYAFEFGWRDKRGVVEIDALTGNVNREGSIFGGMAKKLATRDALFDMGAEVANLIVPGGAVVVKMVGNATKPR
jgi:hypothetical protein